MGEDYSYYHNGMMVAVQETEWQRQMWIAFTSLKGTLKEEGDKWCAITGTMPEHYLAGFGDNPYNAMQEWNKEYLGKKPVDALSKQ